jgi:integrase/recombinase XerC
MTKSEIRNRYGSEATPMYGAGQHTCPICSAPLPAHQTWPGARYRFCGSPGCKEEVMKLRGGRYIGSNEHNCEGGGCSNFVPEGRYSTVPIYLSCSAACWYRRMNRGEILFTCDCGCGEKFYRRGKRENMHGLYFLNPQHQGAYFGNKYLDETCGPFRGIVDEYLKGFASLHYQDLGDVRTAFGSFFSFLNEHHVESLDDVKPKIVTQYLSWAKNLGRLSVPRTIARISVFFDWMIAEERREAANPVLGQIHGFRQKKRLPRPLDANQLDFTWQLLQQRGNARLRFATAIGEESGLRIGEVCNLRIGDVDPLQQTVFVRLPNKTKTERSTFFSDKTKQYFSEWMEERNPNCDHDHLLHNTLSDPLSGWTLTEEFKRTLCKTYEGKKIHDIGLDKWSFHRLRHTMASNLVAGGADAAAVMKCGGWKTFDAMAGYARVEDDLSRRSYNEAIRRAQNQKQSEPPKRTITPTELLERRNKEVSQKPHFEISERCV